MFHRISHCTVRNLMSEKRCDQNRVHMFGEQRVSLQTVGESCRESLGEALDES